MKGVAWRRAAVAVVGALVLLARGGAAAGCGDIGDELTCEATYDCYWANWTAIPAEECREIPKNSTMCECPGGSCTDDPPEGERSGCEPHRFCVYAWGGVNNCNVKEVTQDSDCLEDIVFTDAFSCLMKTTDAPTPSPTDATLRPTLSPTNATSSSSESEVPIIAIGGATGGSFVLLVLVSVFFIVRRDKDKDTKQVRGVISMDTYMAYAKPAVPDLPVRQELPEQRTLDLQGMNLVVIFDFDAENDDELDATSGTELLGLLKYDEWWEARAPDGRMGIIPCAYVSEVGLTDGIVDPGSLEAFNMADF
ncbi:Protein kinase C and casein kinase substrate in neurons protein 1 [Hondaea fermentalgiana]|uniref:Protein kinase C and casein kinase substrate in neurons protein 1 n=1 Tax=Hondaea fermentalgiana TaxID=2315210 RepID=A0A2R5GS29_9STRA|nr:Protein kinase C and casein kinase substrate in neurons protein 1 [Hondaea fermentalgiana]|eukprot:GBG33109.1 Protein kinase C and casein kinase substrate in neurons protein 1 [Hondaea fermentalgiana]